MNVPVIKEEKKQDLPSKTVDFIKENWVFIALGIGVIGVYIYLYDEKMSSNIKKRVKKLVDEVKDSTKTK